MAARAIWKGIIRFGSIRIPVKLYSAVVDRNIRFQLLHDQDYVPLKQRMVNSTTEETVPHGNIRKAYEVERGLFVVLTEKELESLEPKPSRDIEVTHFVDRDQIGHHWFVRPYYAGPDGDNDDYFALAEALEQEGKVGIASWVMRGHRYSGALVAQDGYLVLVTLRNAEEVIPRSQLKPPEGKPLDKKERELAGQLLKALEEEFVPSDYRDEYRQRVMKLIESKKTGRPMRAPKRAKKPKTTSLAQSLRESLKRVKQR